MQKNLDLKWKKYVAIAQLAVTHGLKNYKTLIGLSIFLVTCLIIFAHLWKLVAVRYGAVEFDPDHLLWYIALNEWVLISIPEIQLDMEQDLRSGKLAYMLPRPISYLGSVFAEGVGTLVLNLLVLGTVTFVFTWAWLGSHPLSLPGFIVTLVFGILAGLLALIFQMLVGLSAFWLQDVAPFSWVWEKLLFMLGGLFIPLSVYPAWLQYIAVWTPFPAILGQRSALVLHYDVAQVVWLTISLLTWGAISTLALFFLYRRALHALTIGGG